MAKFEKINLNQNKIDVQLNSKENISKQILFDDYNWKKSHIIKETDWLSAELTDYHSSPVQESPVPHEISFDESLDFNCPAKFLPYINIELITKSPEDIELVGLLPYNSDPLFQDYIEILGNGGTSIYTGPPVPNLYIFSIGSLGTSFTTNFSKPVYYAQIEYTSGGDDYLVFGTLQGIRIKDGVGLDYWEIFELTANSSRFTNFTNSNVEGYSVHKVGAVFTPNVFISKNLSSNDILYYFFSANEYKNGVFNDFGDIVIPHGVTITSISISLNGYWCFYEPVNVIEGTTRTIGATTVFPIEAEGIFNRIQLVGLPSKIGDDDYRYWNTIVLKRNTGTHPSALYDSLLSVGSRQQAIIKLFKTTDNIKERYRVILNGVLVFKSLTNTSSPVEAPVYNDIYSKNATTYVASETHTLKNVPKYTNYVDPVQEIQYKIQISLINPYEFSDRKNYNA